MKKLLNTLLSVGMVITLLITTLLCLPVYADSLNHSDQVINMEISTFNEDLPTFQKAGEIAFGVFHSILVDDIQSVDSKYEGITENYAGSVIDNDGKLILYFSGEPTVLSSLKSEFSNAGVKKDDVQFVNVEYSYNELKEQQNAMWLIRNQAINEDSVLYEWARKIKSVAVNPENNCVDVLVNNFETSDFLLCEKYFSIYSYKVKTIEGTGEIREELTVYPGQGIGTGGSLGFRCKINNVAGFMTAVHTASYYGIVVNSGNTQLGTITKGAYDGKADFAFVETTSSTSVSLSTNTSPAYTLHSTNYVVALPANYTVYLAGVNSSSARSGQVIYNDYAISSGTEWLLCSYSASGGDSGGVIFANVNGDYCVYGIHDGDVNYNGGIAKYATKLNTMRKYYTVTLY